VEVACLCELELKGVESASLSSTLIVQVQILSEVSLSFRFEIICYLSLNSLFQILRSVIMKFSYDYQPTQNAWE